MKFKSRLFRLLGIFFLGYVVLFLLCLGYGYMTESSGEERIIGGVGRESSDLGSSIKKNYASTAYKAQAPASEQPQATGMNGDISQKYEQRGDITAQSSRFDEDEKAVRTLIAQHAGLVQLERSTGTKGKRQLVLSVGVKPAGFDPFFTAMQGIGKLTASNVTKLDKTNDFLTLRAQKVSLEKNLVGLGELKKQNGTVADFIALQARILEVEQSLQNLGVNLGEFDETNSFCTINFSLVEVQKVAPSSRSFLSHAKNAVFLSGGLYMAFLSAIFFSGLTAFILLLLVDKFNLLQRLWETLEHK